VISPDLTRNDKSKQTISGGLTPDNIGVEYGDVVFAIAESPITKGEIWAGTNDGLVQLTRDGGKTWTNVTANIPGMLQWGTVSNIEPSRYTDGTAFITVDGHQVNNRDPWVYKTTDFGKSWALIVKGVPKSPLSYAHVIREDPTRKGLLYLGTENGLYVSFDDGAQWQPLQGGLPHAPVYGLAVQPHFHDLVVATYGRGFYILDDLTPLEQWAPATAAKNVSLLKPRDQYRFRNIADPFTEMDDIVAGQNPPRGALLNYWIKPGTKDTTAKDSVTITIADASGAVVRTLKAPAKAGLNRTNWDLHSERTKEATIHASPLYENWFEVPGEGERAPGISRYAVLEPPGTYKVTLKFGGEEESQPLVVLKDPLSGGSEQEIAAQMQTEHAIVADMNEAVTEINALEVVRGQLTDLADLAKKDSTYSDLKGSTADLMTKLVSVEKQLYQMQLTGRGQDGVRWPAQLAEQLFYLAGSVGGSDYAPTASQKEVAQVLHARLVKVKAEVEALLKNDVPAFNERLRGRSVHPVISEGR